jgi:hypothetical protein
MGKTVPSYRIAMESEIGKWKSFRKALKNQQEQEAFDELMDMCRNNAMAGSSACNPIIFEPMVMSMLLARQVRIQKLERQLNDHCQKSGDYPWLNQHKTFLVDFKTWKHPQSKQLAQDVKLSKITAKLKGTIDIIPLLGKFQQLGLVKIVYNPSVDDEPLVQITEKGKIQAMEPLVDVLEEYSGEKPGVLPAS